MVYIAYNRLYLKGRPITAPFRAAGGKTLAEAKRTVTNYNRRWNALRDNRRKGLKAKCVSIKKRKR